MSNLPPLNKVDKDLVFVEETTLTQIKCNHTLELISGNEARCTKCTVGYIGPNIIELVKASQKS